MPALTRFTDGTGPIFAGKVFPFAFITIACGAISGFHALIASGTTPKLLERESDARLIGYGAMLMESFVAIMALIAACALDAGRLLRHQRAGQRARRHRPDGIGGHRAAGDSPSRLTRFTTLAKEVGETTLLSRTGGAPSLAVGMAHMFCGRARAAAARWRSGTTSRSCSRRCSS